MMDGLEIRLHPTLDILVREDGAVLLPKGWSFGAAQYGVRYKDDPNGYKKAWAKAHPESRNDSIRRYAEKRRDRKEGKA